MSAQLFWNADMAEAFLHLMLYHFLVKGIYPLSVST